MMAKKMAVEQKMFIVALVSVSAVLIMAVAMLYSSGIFSGLSEDAFAGKATSSSAVDLRKWLDEENDLNKDLVEALNDWADKQQQANDQWEALFGDRE